MKRLALLYSSRRRRSRIHGLALSLALVSCSGGQSTPTSPTTRQSDGGATTIAGTAVIRGTSSSSALRTAATMDRGGLDGRPHDLRVCVARADLCLDVSPSGAFELRGDFESEVRLHFVGRGQDVTVTVHNVQPGETIFVTVELEGDRGRLRIDGRQHGDVASDRRRLAMCHVTGNGRYLLIEIDQNAERAHLAHGDGYPGGDVPTVPAAVFGDRCQILGPSIRIEKATNGLDADRRPGPSIPPGTPITWTYQVINTGTQPLTNVAVTDDDPSLDLRCASGAVLAPGDRLTCRASGVAVAGAYTNLGTVTADHETGVVSDSDPSNYVGESDAPAGPRPPIPDGRESRVELCHRTGNGYRLVEVARSAEPAHLQHGDGYPGRAVPGARQSTFDASCRVRS